jgi:hypothetical protein
VFPTEPRAWLKEFLADHSIQLLAYSGALLAAVAVLLFDLSGSSPTRFAAVAALEAAFAATGWYALRRPALRAIAFSYIALAALLLPLTALAAWVFLRLGPLGVPGSLAVTLAAGSCAGVYAALATALRSRVYAAVSLTALGVFTGAGLVWAGAGTLAGTGLVALAVGLAALAVRSHRGAGVFALPADAGTGVAALAGCLWTLADASTGRSWHLTAALALAAVAAAVRVALGRRADLAWVIAALVPLPPLSLAHDLVLTAVEARALLLALAAAGTAAALTLGGRLGRRNIAFLRGEAAVLIAVAALLPEPAGGPPGAVLGAATADALALALTARRWPWLWLPAATFALGWYWLVRTLVPPPPAPGPADLARVYPCAEAGPPRVPAVGAGGRHPP